MNIENISAFLKEKIAPLQSDVMQLAQSPEGYYQLVLILIIFAISYALSGLLRRKIESFQEPKDIPAFSAKWFLGRSGRFLYPLLVIGLLAIIWQLSTEIIGEAVLVEAVLRFVKVWILWVILRAYVLNPIVRTVGLWILVPAALLHLFSRLEPVISWLNQYGFTVGEINITAYTVIKSIFFVSIVIWLGRIISHTVSGYIMGASEINRSTKELFIKLFDIMLYAALAMAVLNLVGIDLTALALFSGALGVGLGFGLQKIASNFISGIILLMEKSVNINNLIEMNDGVYGYVRKLGARASIVETFDGKEVMVPNEDFITSRVANLTHSNSKGRVEIMVGVSYDTDLDLAYQLILDSANESDKPSQEERFRPEVFLREFGDSSVNFLMTFWLDDVTKGRWRAKSDVMRNIWRKFKENDIEIPFPQRDLHLRSAVPMEMMAAQEPKQSPSKQNDEAEND